MNYDTPLREQIAATLRECIGNANHDGRMFVIATTGSRILIDGLAAAIAHDLGLHQPNRVTHRSTV